MKQNNSNIKKKLCIRLETNWMNFLLFFAKSLSESIAIYSFAVTVPWSTGPTAFLASNRSWFVFTFAVN